MKKLLSLFLAFLVVFSLFSVPSIILAEGDEDSGEEIVEVVEEITLDRVIPETPVQIDIIHTNDIHANLEEVGAGAANERGLFIRVASFIKDRVASNPNTIVVDAGDFSQGSAYVGLTKGALMFEAINGIYDVATIGNHEFDWGRETLEENRKKATGVTFVNANIVWKKKKVANDKGKMVTRKNVPMFIPNTIIERAGVKIGFFGIASQDFKGKVAPTVWKNAKILNPITVARKQVAALRKEGADIIVAVVHMGTEDNGGTTTPVLRSKVAGIDLIIDGHSHTVCPTTVSGCPTPARGAIIASTGGLGSQLNYCDGVGIVKINVSTTGYSFTTEKVKMTAIQSAYTDDPTIRGLLDAVKAENATFINEKVGEAAHALTALRWPANPLWLSVRGGESIMGNVIADAYRAKTGADIGFINGGGVRASIAAGDITNGILLAVQPYGNNVVTLKVSGKMLKRMLEHSVSTYTNTTAGTEHGGFLQVSGMKFTFDPTKAVGSRVTEIIVGTKKCDPKKTYIVALPDFIAMGGDNYTFLAKIKVVGNFGEDFKIVSAYIKDFGGPVNTELEGRITNLNP